MITRTNFKKDEEQNLEDEELLTISQVVKNLEREANILKKCRKIQNEILCNCAYHDKNLNMQFNQMKNAGASDEELKLVVKGYEIRGKYGNKLLLKLKDLNIRMEKELGEI